MLKRWAYLLVIIHRQSHNDLFSSKGLGYVTPPICNWSFRDRIHRWKFRRKCPTGPDRVRLRPGPTQPHQPFFFLQLPALIGLRRLKRTTRVFQGHLISELRSVLILTYLNLFLIFDLHAASWSTWPKSGTKTLSGFRTGYLIDTFQFSIPKGLQAEYLQN